METVFYTFCAYLPIHLLAYLPFFDLLRFGKRWMAVTVAGNVLIHLLGVAWVVSIGRPELVMAVGGAMVPISLALYFLNIKLAPSKLLFTYMLLVNYQIIALGIASFLAVRVFHAGSRSWESGVICLVLFILAWLPMYRLFHYAARQVYRINAPQLWRVIWLVPAVMSGIVTVLTGGLQEELVESWRFLLTRTSLLLCVVAVYWVLVNALEACGRMTEGRRFLRLISAVHLDTLTVIMDNSFDGHVRVEAGKFRSSKREDFGVGLTSIQAVARKCGGNAQFEPDGRVFRSSVYVRV